MKELKIADTDVRLLKDVIQAFLWDHSASYGLDHQVAAAKRLLNKLERLSK